MNRAISSVLMSGSATMTLLALSASANTVSYDKLAMDCQSIDRKGSVIGQDSVSCRVETMRNELTVQISTETRMFRPITYWLGDRQVQVKLGKLPMRGDCGRVDIAVRYVRQGEQYAFDRITPRNDCASDSLQYDRKPYVRVVGLTDWVGGPN